MSYVKIKFLNSNLVKKVKYADLQQVIKKLIQNYLNQSAENIKIYNNFIKKYQYFNGDYDFLKQVLKIKIENPLLPYLNEPDVLCDNQSLNIHNIQKRINTDCFVTPDDYIIEFKDSAVSHNTLAQIILNQIILNCVNDQILVKDIISKLNKAVEEDLNYASILEEIYPFIRVASLGDDNYCLSYNSAVMNSNNLDTLNMIKKEYKIVADFCADYVDYMPSGLLSKDNEKIYCPYYEIQDLCKEIAWEFSHSSPKNAQLWQIFEKNYCGLNIFFDFASLLGYKVINPLLNVLTTPDYTLELVNIDDSLDQSNIKDGYIDFEGHFIYSSNKFLEQLAYILLNNELIKNEEAYKKYKANRQTQGKNEFSYANFLENNFSYIRVTSLHKTTFNLTFKSSNLTDKQKEIVNKLLIAEEAVIINDYDNFDNKKLQNQRI